MCVWDLCVESGGMHDPPITLWVCTTCVWLFDDAIFGHEPVRHNPLPDGIPRSWIGPCSSGGNTFDGRAVLCTGLGTSLLLLFDCKILGLSCMILFSQNLCRQRNMAKIGMHPRIPSKVVNEVVRSGVFGGGKVCVSQYFSSLLSEQWIIPSQISSVA